MSHLLDTNICLAHFRRPAGLACRFIQLFSFVALGLLVAIPAATTAREGGQFAC